MSTAKTREHATLQQAEAWLVTMQSGQVSAFDQRRFANWLRASETHREVYLGLAQAWNEIPELLDGPWHDELLAATRPGPLRKLLNALGSRAKWLVCSQIEGRSVVSPTRLTGALGLSVALLAFTLAQFGTKNTVVNHYASERGQLRSVTLDDGSVVTLSAQSTLEVRMSPGKREAALLGGRAFFAIAKDSARPFYVSAGPTSVRVVGTQFDVSKGLNEVRVAVLEGVVEVSKQVVHAQYQNARSTTQLTLHAGEMVTAFNASSADLPAKGAVAPDDVSPWREGRFRYDNAQLAQIASDLSRHRQADVKLASAELGEIKVTASFRVDEIDQVVDDLAQTLPISVTHLPNNAILISHQRGDRPASLDIRL